MRSLYRPLLCLSCLLCAVYQAPANAATISITPSYVQSFDAAQNPIGVLPDGGAPTPVGGYLQYEFRLTLNDTEAGDDFWTAIFDVQLGPGLENASGWLDPGVAQANGYYPAVPSLAIYDANGATPGGVESHWKFGNADFGVDPNDLESIIVEASSAEAANRQYGEAGRPGEGEADGLGYPTLVGTILVRRTEVLSSSVAVVPIGGDAWGIYTNNEAGDGDFDSLPSSSFTTSTIHLAVPEPATLILALAALPISLLPHCGLVLTHHKKQSRCSREKRSRDNS